MYALVYKGTRVVAIVITHILRYCNNLTEMDILLILQDSCKQTYMQHAQKRAHIFTIATTVVACHCCCGWQLYICYLILFAPS